MIEVRIVEAYDLYDSIYAYDHVDYIVARCPLCNKFIAAAGHIHNCYNCKQDIVSPTLLIGGGAYRVNYHFGRVTDKGDILSEVEHAIHKTVLKSKQKIGK